VDLRSDLKVVGGRSCSSQVRSKQLEDVGGSQVTSKSSWRTMVAVRSDLKAVGGRWWISGQI
jgi:hypothetical protein